MNDWLTICARALAIFVLIVFTDSARAEYVRKYPGQPGWGVNLFGWGAILILASS